MIRWDFGINLKSLKKNMEIWILIRIFLESKEQSVLNSLLIHLMLVEFYKKYKEKRNKYKHKNCKKRRRKLLSSKLINKNNHLIKTIKIYLSTQFKTISLTNKVNNRLLCDIYIIY
jgi:hypothetical protein